MSGVRATVIVLSVLTALAGPSRGEPAAARAHFDDGVARYQRADYAGAAEAFAAAYQEEPTLDHLYAWAQAERLAGNCERAVELYEQFLAAELSAAQVELGQGGLALCRVAMASSPVDAGPGDAPADDKPPEPDRIEPTATEPPAVSARGPVDAGASPRWYDDALGHVLTVAGIAGVGVGAAFFVTARADVRAADAATSYDEYGRLADRGSRRESIAWVSGSAGVALIIAGVIRFATRSTSSHGVSATTTTTGSERSFALTFGGSF